MARWQKGHRWKALGNANRVMQPKRLLSVELKELIHFMNKTWLNLWEKKLFLIFGRDRRGSYAPAFTVGISLKISAFTAQEEISLSLENCLMWCPRRILLVRSSIWGTFTRIALMRSIWSTSIVYPTIPSFLWPGAEWERTFSCITDLLVKVARA